MRQAGRYMPEYRQVRKHHSILEICKNPELAAEVTITAAERLGVDAAIIFADLLLPLEVMGMDFEFLEGEGPKVGHPVREAGAIAQLKSDRAGELGYVGESIQIVARHFEGRVPVIGFCGAPFTLAASSRCSQNEVCTSGRCEEGRCLPCPDTSCPPLTPAQRSE